MSDYIALRDLGDIVENTKKKIAAEFCNKDVKLSSGFKSAFTNAIRASGNSIQIEQTTSVITTSANQQIFLPNQWFVLAAYAVDLVNEIVRYRNITEAVLETNIQSYVPSAENLVKKKQKAYDLLKSAGNNGIIALFKNDILSYLHKNGVSKEQAEHDAILLIKFVSDEAWWLGGKNISRSNDFYVSPTLSVLNLVNASQSYVATITWLYINNADLAKELETMIETDDLSHVNKNDSNDANSIFLGFEPWLTSYNNPDYTGKQKYAGYSKALVKLINYMYEQNMIYNSELNDKNVDKYHMWLHVYDSSEEAKEFDEKKNSTKTGSAALNKYIKYIEYLNSPHAKPFDYEKCNGTGVNKILYGMPGCGKSYHIDHAILGKDKETKEYKGDYEKENIIRTTFYQDYSNTDFVGQILPKISKSDNGEKDIVEYIFNPGPFTIALIQAISNPTKKVALVIEEINRGNAPAIFGDIFQLLDRDENSISEYGIVNVGIMDYLNDYDFIVDGEKKRYVFSEIKIPGNLDIFATMNTSDQNVYTLDTAFIRRWDKERIKNSFRGCSFASIKVPGMDYTWQEFVDAINGHIAKHLEDLQVNEDKQIGVFFVKERLLKANNPEKFAYKVFDYLWSDVAKLDHDIFFNHFDTLEALITAYVKDGVKVFKPGIFDKKETPQVVEEDENNE